MATETVPQGLTLASFDGYDQSVFLEWLEGLTDMMQTGGDPSRMADNTMSIVGGLMNALVRGAFELGEREAKERS